MSEAQLRALEQEPTLELQEHEVLNSIERLVGTKKYKEINRVAPDFDFRKNPAKNEEEIKREMEKAVEYLIYSDDPEAVAQKIAKQINGSDIRAEKPAMLLFW